jgi:hypothetical protein
MAGRLRKRMWSGDHPGLQNRRAAGLPVTGGFDPHSLPPKQRTELRVRSGCASLGAALRDPQVFREHRLLARVDARANACSRSENGFHSVAWGSARELESV